MHVVSKQMSFPFKATSLLTKGFVNLVLSDSYMNDNTDCVMRGLTARAVILFTKPKQQNKSCQINIINK